MNINDIKIGKYCISRYALQIREITEDLDNDVQFITYNISTGNPKDGIAVTSKLKMSQWAEGEATSEEIKKLHKSIQIQADNSRMTMVLDILKAIPDDMLLYEIKKRGISIK